jgi:hypothetical protein
MVVSSSSSAAGDDNSSNGLSLRGGNWNTGTAISRALVGDN